MVTHCVLVHIKLAIGLGSGSRYHDGNGLPLLAGERGISRYFDAPRKELVCRSTPLGTLLDHVWVTVSLVDLLTPPFVIFIVFLAAAAEGVPRSADHGTCGCNPSRDGFGGPVIGLSRWTRRPDQARGT